ncbi:MAG: transcription termination factor NusA [Candidatus Eisenbacteria bacterium]|nr:transcription termination factor NusA [Candidatus Eisenbacteria bacterium]
MNYNIIEALGQIAREKSVDRKLLIETLEQGLLSAARKKFGLNAQVGVRFDEVRGGIEMWLTKSVVETITDPSLEMTLRDALVVDPNSIVGQEVMIPLDIAEFGRNAIMAAKQVLVQRVREAEREMVYDEYVDKVGSLVRGVVQQVDRGSVFVKINLTEAVIPARELISRDRFRQRDHVRAYVLSVDKQSKGPQVILSRTHPDFLVKLFEAEVPEIAEGIVEIKSVAREAGHRSKIAVYSRDDRIDAVGACVGIKGSRVQSIVRELGGERIDIVPWSSDPALFVSRALNPAKVLQAAAQEADKRVTVVVVDDQLSLAIGKGGQNARLAARLTGWHIDLISQSENEARKKAGVVDVPVEELEGLTPKMAQKLVQSGIETAREVEKAGLAGLTAVEGVGEKTAEKLLATAVAALVVAGQAASAAAAATEPGPIGAAEAESVMESEASPPRDSTDPDEVDISEAEPDAPRATGDEAHNPVVEAEPSESMMESMDMKPDRETLLRGRGEDEHKLWDDPDENEDDDDEEDDADEEADDKVDDEEEDFEEDDLTDLDIDLDGDNDDE